MGMESFVLAVSIAEIELIPAMYLPSLWLQISGDRDARSLCRGLKRVPDSREHAMLRLPYNPAGIEFAADPTRTVGSDEWLPKCDV